MSKNRKLESVLNELPLHLRPVSKPLAEKLLNYAEKADAAAYAAQVFDHMKAKGTKPPAINSIREPKLQVTELFLNNATVKEKYLSISNITRKAQNDLLDAFIGAKREEEKYYRNTFLARKIVEDDWKKCMESLRHNTNQTYGSRWPAPIEQAFAQYESRYDILLGGVLALSTGRFSELEDRRLRKMNSKTETDISMSGTDINSKTIESAVSAVLKRRGQSERDKRKARKGNNSPSTSTSIGSFSSRKDKPNPKGRRSAEGRQNPEKEVAILLSKRTPNFRIGRVGTYPKEYFKASRKARVLFQQTCSTGKFLETLRPFDEKLHMGPDVMLPRNIQFFLSLNLKFIFPQKIKRELPIEAFEVLENNLRRKVFYGEREQEDDPFREAPSGTLFDPSNSTIEAGISAGRDSVLRQVQSVPTDDYLKTARVSPFEGLCCTVKQLKRFMLEKSFMALITDKNLGISVVSRNWYLDQGYGILSGKEFEEVGWSEVPWDFIEEGCRQVSEFDLFPKNVRRYLSNFDKERKLPVFHGIPKVHKQPWKLRPIVPMHSFVTGRIGYVLHWYLYKAVQKIPTICVSSKQLVQQALAVPGLRKTPWDMGTGDVTAMYTNIHTDELVNAIRAMLRSYTNYSTSLIRGICHLVRFVNNNVFFQFGGRVYHQLQGIAMGLHCGPAMANLYLAAWEEWAVKGEQGFLFFRRYIDDIFFIRRKGSDAAQRYIAPKLTIVWENEERVPFLDVEFYRDSGNLLGVRSYFKPLNNYQYIPWNSGHPLSVKKGIVKTELLRYRASNSHRKDFLEARRLLLVRLCRRGYPYRVVKAWSKQVQWIHPLGKKRESYSIRGPKELAKTEYNPVWSYVSLQKAWSKMTLKWDASGFTREKRPFYDGVVKSQQRTTNLWDVVRRLNKEILPETLPAILEDSDSTAMVLDSS